MQYLSPIFKDTVNNFKFFANPYALSSNMQ